ncbi:unnamed protein product [Darwinula stevensoni]|uniref:Uncharacterized protein n=1 Tax=Darwinula stevensoni TaxID=69355 RepID=A0A7R8X5I9_9CRUS|nr:unnamed protein product [Darwinula stevensoni]CAG0884827.1 unnamed protein product [Darwinula stevensoni]
MAFVAALETKRGDVLDAGLGMTNKKGGCNNDFVAFDSPSQIRFKMAHTTDTARLSPIHSLYLYITVWVYKEFDVIKIRKDSARVLHSNITASAQ